MFEKINKKKLIIIIIAVIVIIIALIVYLVINNKKKQSIETSSTISTSTSEQLAKSVSYVNSYPELYQDSSIVINRENNLLEISKDGKTNKLKLDYLTSPEDQLVVSPNNKMAIGIFPTMAQNGSQTYLLSENNEPVPLNPDISNIAILYDNGDIVYCNNNTGNIAYGNIYDGSERKLAKIESVEADIVMIDDENALYWEVASQADPSNLAGSASPLYKVNIKTGKVSVVIAENTVLDVSISPSGKKLLINRLQNNTVRTWLFSLENNSYLNSLGTQIDIYNGAWNSAENKFAYWQNNTIGAINLETAVTAIVDDDIDELRLGNQLGWEDDNIIIYLQAEELIDTY